MCAPQIALSFNAPDILPENVRLVALRQGVITEVDQKFSPSGRLQSLSQLSRISFDFERLSGIQPEILRLESILNSFGNFGLGSKIHLGQIEIGLDPTINYSVPTFGYGITERWTLGLGFPVINYKNNVRLKRSAGNIQELNQLYRGFDSELDQALDELNVDIANEFRSYLKQKGYRPIRNIDKTYLGDIQIASLYGFNLEALIEGLATTTLTLPTGPKDDPDDILDLGLFGETSIEQEVILSYKAGNGVSLRGGASYRFMIPDKLEIRVPFDINDELPGINQKDTISRSLGDVSRFLSSIHKRFYEFFEIGLGYEFVRKESDSFGVSGLSKEALELNTSYSKHIVKAGINFNSTEYYMRTKKLIPMFIEYRVSDVFKGINTNRQLIHELMMQVYF